MVLLLRLGLHFVVIVVSEAGFLGTLGQLVAEADDLFAKLVDDLGVVGDVKLDVEHVPLHHGLDLLRPVCVLQRVQRVFIGGKCRRNIGDHDGAAVATQRVLEEPGELGVAVGYMLLLLLCRGHLGQLTKRIDAVP